MVREVSASFDAYWNSESAYPAASLIRRTEPQTPWAAMREHPDAVKYLDAVRATPLLGRLLAGSLPLEWAQARVVSDDPSKVLAPPERTELHMLPRLEAAVGAPQRQLDLVGAGTAAMTSRSGRGRDDRTGAMEQARGRA